MMKRFFLVIVMIVISFSYLKAQDIIYFFNTNVIEAVVENVTDDSISYRMYSDPYGPIFTTAIVNVSHITYENGPTHYFSPQNATSEPYYQKMIYLRGNLYIDGEKLKPKKLSEQNLPTIYMQDFISATQLRAIGIPCNIVGGLCMAMGALFLIPEFSDEKIIAYTYIGLGSVCVGGGVTLTVLANKSLKKIADSYNANSASRSKMTLSFGPSASGFGLALNF